MNTIVDIDTFMSRDNFTNMCLFLSPQICDKKEKETLCLLLFLSNTVSKELCPCH